MKPHGDFKIQLVNNVVHVFPTGGFNEQGIQEIRNRVLLIAPKDKAWVLFEHPKNLAGLTPEAAKELLISYQIFGENNCKVVALEICSTWQGVIEKMLNENLNFPFYLNKNLNELEVLIASHFNHV